MFKLFGAPEAGAKPRPANPSSRPPGPMPTQPVASKKDEPPSGGFFQLNIPPSQPAPGLAQSSSIGAPSTGLDFGGLSLKSSAPASSSQPTMFG